MLRPSNSTSPDSGARRPPSTLKRVDLPAPFGPMMPVMVCGAISSEQPASAGNPPKDFVSSAAASIGTAALQFAGLPTEGSGDLLRRRRCSAGAARALHFLEDFAAA